MKAGRLLYPQGGLCFYCRRKLDLSNATIEHVIPKSMGGKNDFCIFCFAHNATHFFRKIGTIAHAHG